MAPKSVTFRQHDHLVSVLFGDLLSHSYNITFSMFCILLIILYACYGNSYGNQATGYYTCMFNLIQG